ncbi:protein mono-ADP-ribosyltransferase PARP14-like isoform X2 [Watersipora subatra]|uniref:protein mono-ADP-ribosyltransferase PARP14-like isoform X2 n=1 Tax=Watersipora subatra TaxID=2589382 RepID=UPI00355C6B19
MPKGAEPDGMSKSPLANQSTNLLAEVQQEDDLDQLTSTNLFVSNLVDVDHQTIYFWVKSLLGVWPLSVQLSIDEEKAMVRIPGRCSIERSMLQEMADNPHFHLRGERLSIGKLPPVTNVQVKASDLEKGSNTIDEFTLESFFSSTKYMCVKTNLDVANVKLLTSSDGQCVYIITYHTTEAALSVLKRNSYKLRKWKFDVAAYYPELGMCSPQGIQNYPPERNQRREHSDDQKKAVLLINDVDDQEIEMEVLELFMSHRRRSEGGPIESWKLLPGKASGTSSVRVIYEEEGIAERVYEFYKQNGLQHKSIALDLELELPWFTKQHDERKLRVSGLDSELDPETLKFYLSALTSTVVTEMFFNNSQTRAVALFKNKIDYGAMIDQHHSIPLEDFPKLKVQQEFRTKDLIATGSKLTREDLELPLENLLKKHFKRDIEVHADEYSDSPDFWRITTEPEALEFVLTQKKLIRRCETLAPFSEFLGLHVTSGVHKKREDIANFVTDPMLLHFVLKVPEGQKKLSEFLHAKGMVMSDDGVITVSPATSKTNDRTVLKNWRKLKPTLEKFIEESFQTYRTEPLTQQVFDRLTPKLTDFFKGQPVVPDIFAKAQPSMNAGNQIAIAGEKAVVLNLSRQLLQMIEQLQAKIREEKEITTITVPNISSHQIDFFNLIEFFKKMQEKHQLQSFKPDPKQLGCIKIVGRPTSIDTVQKEMFDLMPKVNQSKISAKKNPAFVKVLKTKSAEETIKHELKNAVPAVWYLDNKTITIYSAAKDDSQAALNIINTAIWESFYPAERKLDELEKKLLLSQLWTSKKEEMQRMHSPLEIDELEDRSAVVLAGLSQVKAITIEAMKMFFDNNVKRAEQFSGTSDRIKFLTTYRRTSIEDLERQHSVQIAASDGQTSITVHGTRDDIARCLTALTKLHNAVCKDVHIIDNQAMVRHVASENEFLENVGMKTSCLVVEHREEQTALNVSNDVAENGLRYSVKLPSGTTCEVRRDDITVLGGDAIVNAANGDLQHVGGLALAILKKGGNSIQQECATHIRKNGTMMEGSVFTSTAGRLCCKKVIHAVGPKWQGGQYQEERKLMLCIDSCFEECEKQQFQSIAIPPIGTGIFEYPLDKAVKAIVDAVSERERQDEYLPEYVTFVDNKEDSLRHFAACLDKKFAVSKSAPKGEQLSSPYTGRTIEQGTPKYSFISDDMINIGGKINLEIRKGDVIETEDHVLVNSVGKAMNLAAGKVSKAISDRAGPELQKACTGLAPIQVGQVKGTSGYLMECKTILHCFCPQSYEGPSTIQTLKGIVATCLSMAASESHTSITFPALGTGNLRYPVDQVSKGMIEAVTEYAESNPHSSIVGVKIVIYHLDKPTITGFQNELARLREAVSSTPSPASRVTAPKKPKMSVLQLSPFPQPAARPKRPPRIEVSDSKMVGNTNVNILQGDISEYSTVAFVNATDNRMQTCSHSSKVFLDKAGGNVVYELNRLSHSTPVDGIQVTQAGALNGSYIIHVNICSFRGTPRQLASAIFNCLKKCDEMHIVSVAFPTFSKDEVGLASKDMAKTFFQAVFTFLGENPQTELRKIDVIVLKPYKVKHYVHYLNKPADNKGSWWANIKTAAVSFFIASGKDNESEDGDTSDSASDDDSAELDKELHLDIYGNTQADIIKCKRELDNKLHKALETILWSQKASYHDDRDFISKLSALQIAKLEKVAKKNGVRLEVNQRVMDLKLLGLSKDVYTMSEEITNLFKRMEREKTERQNQEYLAKTIRWVYGDERGNWIDFDLNLNKALEDAHSADPNATFRFSMDAENVTLDFNTMTAHTESGTEIKIKRNDRGDGQGVLPWPSTWTGSFETFGEYPLVRESPEYNKVRDNFVGSLGAVKKEILQISRVQNPTLYQQYVILRKDVAKRLDKTEDEVEKAQLWHGTTEEAVGKIVSESFNRSLCGVNATMFGLGTYFAKHAAKSITDEYAKPSKSGEQYVIQTRVIVGEPCKGEDKMKAPPRNARNEQYDSAVDDLDKPTIHVVFRDAAAYPEYVIKCK